MKKLLSLLLTSALAVAMLAGCGGGGDTTTTETADTGDGKVYNVCNLVNGNLGDKSFFDSAGRLVILNAKEQIPRRMTGTRSIAFIFLPSTELKHNRNGVKWCGSTDT